MAFINYEIGGNEVKIEGSEGIVDIPQNRTLMIEKLTTDAPNNPDLVVGLETIEAVFDYFQPKQEISFETEEGQLVKETFQFENVGDFGIKKMTETSLLLNDMNINKEFYANTTRQFKGNRVLMRALGKPETKEGIINALLSVKEELQNSLIEGE